jgi:hypothetical protein
MVHTKRSAKAEAHKRKLTELFVRKAPPRDKAYLVWDEYQHGLALRVQPTGTKSYGRLLRLRSRILLCFHINHSETVARRSDQQKSHPGAICA